MAAVAWAIVARGADGKLTVLRRPRQSLRYGRRNPMRPLEFGWYLPTHGDTTAYGVMEAQIAGSAKLCERVVKAAEQAGFEYLLIPVGSTCWEAWIAGAFMAARAARIKPLVAAR